ncbi:MAG: cyclophilin-like fold protein [Verrucomicrobiia bacterium]
MRIRISWDNGEVCGVLNDTPTAKRLLKALPCFSTASTWGDEVYFRVPVHAELESDSQQVVSPGTICFWVEGQSLAIPFGPPPGFAWRRVSSGHQGERAGQTRRRSSGAEIRTGWRGDSSRGCEGIVAARLRRKGRAVTVPS